MADEPRNTATDAAAAAMDLLVDRDRLDELAAMLTDDFVAQDRRKLVGMPDLDKATYLQARLSFPDDLRTADTSYKVIATRGDLLGLAQAEQVHKDGWTRTFLAIFEADADGRWKRSVLYDSDDMDAAVAELDRLHHTA